MIFKEIRIALLIGVALAIVNGVRIILMYDTPNKVDIAIVLGLSMIATIALSKTLGGALPIAAKALRLDPALMASPLITTIVDSCSVLVYFNIAVAVLHIG